LSSNVTHLFVKELTAKNNTLKAQTSAKENPLGSGYSDPDDLQH